MLLLLGILGASTRTSAAGLTLDEAIRLALQRNQSLKVSAFTPQIARANVLTEYGRFDPEINFSRSQGEREASGFLATLPRPSTTTDRYSLSLGGSSPWGLSYRLEATADNQRGSANPVTSQFGTFGGISVTQPLLRNFGFAANLGGLRIAKANRRIADWQYRGIVIDAVTNVIFSYNRVLEVQEALKIARLSRDVTGRLVEQNLARNRIGIMSDADVTQAQAALATRDDAIISAERTVRDTENQFRQLIGETQFPVDGPPLELEALPPAVPLSIDAALDLKRAYDLRPDYLAARTGVDRQRISKAIAQNQLLPTVNLVGSYGYAGDDPDFGAARRQVRDRDARAYSIGVELSVPLTFAQERGRLRAARLTLRQAEADLVDFEQDIAVSIAAAAREVETTRKRTAISRIALDFAEKALDAETKKDAAGTGRTLDLLQSQTNLTFAQNSLSRALADERRARANYERQLGTTLESHNITLD